MANITYQLRAEYVGAYTGGTIRVADDRSYNVGAALTAGSGTITVPDSDHLLTDALDAYGALQRTGSTAAPAVPPPPTTLRRMRLGRGASPGETVLQAGRDTDLYNRFEVDVDGNIRTGSGAAAPSPFSAGSSQSLPLTATPIPGWLDSRRPWNSVGDSQGNIVTTPEGVQYLAWYGEGAYAMIGRRTLPDGLWETFQLDAAGGHAMGQVGAPNDTHEFLSLAVDGDGRVHLAGHLHNDPLRYIRSGPAGDITTWTAPGMIGTDEDSTSYPQFCRLPSGDLLFMYRNGVSGAGDTFLNRYSIATDTWTRVGKLFSGLSGTPASNAYPAHLVVSPKNPNELHLMGFRRVNGASTYLNADYWHIMSPDQGATWRTIAGAPLTLPIDVPTGLPIILPTGTDAGLQGLSSDVDEDGHPHAAVTLYDSARKTQIVHIWHDGSAWHTDYVSSLTYHETQRTGNPLSQVAQQPVIACGRKGRTVIVWRTMHDNRRGLVMATVIDKNAAPVERVLANVEHGGWEPSLDKTAAALRNELHVTFTPSALMVTDPEFPEFMSYGAGNGVQWGSVLSAPIDRLLELDAGNTPRLESRVAMPIPAATVTATAMTDVAGALHPLDPLLTRKGDRLILCRIRVRAKIDATPNVGSIALVEAADSGRADRTVVKFDSGQSDSLAVTSTAYKTAVSPWVPVNVLFGDWRKGGTLRLQAMVSAGTLTISGGLIEIATVVGPDQRPLGVLARRPVQTGLQTIGGLAIDWNADGWADFAADGAAVGVLDDRAKDSTGLVNNTLRQSGGTQQPLLKRALVNGHNALRFDGTNDYMDIRAGEILYPLLDGVTLFAVVNGVSTTGTRVIFHIGDATGGIEFGISTQKAYVQVAGGATLAQGAINLGAAAHVIVFTRDADGNTVLTVDGAVDATASATASFTDASPVIVMGRRGTGSPFFLGDIARAGVFARALPATVRKQLESTLGAWAGVAITP